MFRKAASAYGLANKFLQNGDVKNARIAMGLGDGFRKLAADLPSWTGEWPEGLGTHAIGADEIDFAKRDIVKASNGQKIAVVTVGVTSERGDANDYRTRDVPQYEVLAFPVKEDGTVEYGIELDGKEAKSESRAAALHERMLGQVDVLAENLVQQEGKDWAAEKLSSNEPDFESEAVVHISSKQELIGTIHDHYRQRNPKPVIFTFNGHLFHLAADKNDTRDRHLYGAGVNMHNPNPMALVAAILDKLDLH